MGSFVFSSFDGISGYTNVIHKCLAYLLSLNRDVPYSSAMPWIHYCIKFSLLHSASGEHIPIVTAKSAIGLLTLQEPSP